MTAQISDVVIFREEHYALTAVEGDGLFTPSMRAITPGAVGTACWRGFVCHYEVATDRLVLRQLDVGHEGPPPAIDGITPVKKDWVWQYAGLAIHVDFSGRLLIGKGDVSVRPYLNMGFRPAWLYGTVWDLTFVNGQQREAHDRTAELAAVRERLGEAGAKPRVGETVEAWVGRTFSLTYAYSWPDVSNDG